VAKAKPKRQRKVLTEEDLEAKRKAREERKQQRRADAAVAMQEVMEQLRTPATHPRATRRFTEEDFATILDNLAAGRTATQTCRELGVSMPQLLKHVDEDASGINRKRYAQARIYQAESWADSLIDLATAPIPIAVVAMGQAQAEISHRALIFNVKRWLMGKYHIGFQDKQTLALEGGDPERPVRSEHTFKSVEEFRRELEQRNLPVTRMFEDSPLEDEPKVPRKRTAVTIEHE
jgi:hypothetical protein